MIAANNNIIELGEFYHNQDTGLQLSRFNTSYSSAADRPSNNIISNGGLIRILLYLAGSITKL